jgi:hypothetical protein
MKTTRLAALYELSGPFASATVDVSHDNENAAHEHELRVRAVADELKALGPDDDDIELLTARLSEQVHEPAPVARTVVVAGGNVVFDELMYTRVDNPVVSWGPLPDIMAWLEHEDGTTPFVLALVDHEGGDVGVYVSDVPEPQEQTSAGGETQYVHKVPVGGWSALRYQHTTENVWKQNAEAVASEIEKHVRKGYHLVLLGGDPYSVATVVKRLEDAPATVVALEAGSRSEDGGDEALAQAVREALFEHAVARRLEDSHQLKERLGRDRAAATGVREVADAFVRGQVETLLLDPGAAAQLTVTPQEHPGLVLGNVPEALALRADLALVAAAALTAADVRVAPSSTIGGSPVAALLRWDQASDVTS